MMRNEETKVDVRKFWVRNFKSLKDFELDLEKVNVLVGKNGSGKTNVIEALKLLKMIVEYFKGVEVNPFLEWWGYNNVVWRKNERLNIAIGFEYETEIYTEFLVEPNVRAQYEITFTGIGGEFNIIKEKVIIPRTIELIKTSSSIEITIKDISESICEEIKVESLILSDSKSEIINLRYYLLELLPANIKSLYEPFKNKIDEKKFKKDLIRELKGFCKVILNLFKRKIKLKSIYEGFLLEKIVNEYKIAFYVDNYIEVLDGYITNYIETAMKNKIYELLESSSFRDNYPLLHEIFDYAIAKKNNTILRVIIELIAYEPLDVLRGRIRLITNAIIGAYIIANKSVILKKLDYKSVREPIKLKKEDILTEDGSNLTAVLYSMGKGRIPERIDLAVKYAFGENCKIGIEPTSDGRAYIKFFEKGIELSPPAIPDGLYKLIALETALEYNAPIIAIDEFENSLYVDVIRYILDELRNSSSKAILTTHSPAVMDFADPSEIVILKKDENGETKAYRFKKPQKIQELLKKEGITPSEYIIYKEMSSDKEL